MKTMKIMLVDDEERFLMTTQKLLSKMGYDVLTATGGQECLNMLDRHNIHVVILDVKMPGMDGVETLKHIKRRHPLVEVIMLTGHATVESAVEGLKSGATDYLMKPTGIEELVSKAEEAYAKRKGIESKMEQARTLKFMSSSPREIMKDIDKPE